MYTLLPHQFAWRDSVRTSKRFWTFFIFIFCCWWLWSLGGVESKTLEPMRRGLGFGFDTELGQRFAWPALFSLKRQRYYYWLVRKSEDIPFRFPFRADWNIKLPRSVDLFSETFLSACASKNKDCELEFHWRCCHQCFLFLFLYLKKIFFKLFFKCV